MTGCCPLCGGAFDTGTVSILADRGTIVQFGRATNLTRKEMGVFMVLYEARPRVVSKERIISLLYDLEQDEPHIKIVDVFICKLRKKLEFVDLTIETSWGQGYWLRTSADFKTVAREAVA